MKKNKITSILKYTKTQESQLLQSHQKHLDLLKFQEERLDTLLGELEELRMMDHTKITLQELMNLHGYADLVKVKITDQENIVTDQKDVVYTSAQKIVEVRKDLKKYEKLESKIVQKLTDEEEKTIAKQLDEIGIRNYMFNN